MATGPEMLLKALGLDPQAMKVALESTIKNINSLAASMKEINASLEKIDGRLTSMEAKIGVDPQEKMVNDFMQEFQKQANHG